MFVNVLKVSIHLKLILNLFSGDPKFPLIPKVGPSPDIKELFWRLSELNDELLSAPKIITFLAVSLSKLQKSPLSNVIPYPLYTYFSLSLFFTIWIATNKQFLNLKLLVGFLRQAFNS